MPTFSNGETGLSVRNKLNKAINLTDRVMIVDDVTQLASLVYDLNSQWGVAPGMQVVTAREGFSYDVLSAAEATFDIQPGTVRLNLLPNADGNYNFRGMLPAANGTTDDYPLLAKLLAKPLYQGTGDARYASRISIYFPRGNYFMGSTIDLKGIVRLFGDAGFPSQDYARLTFAANTGGITINRFNTDSGTSGTSGVAADASTIEGLWLNSQGGSDLTKHGVWMRARGCVRACFISGFPGNGIHVYAWATEPGALQGNANVFYVESVHCSRNNGNGFYVEGADANAGVIINLDCSANGRCGIWDNSFLGNTYIACHVATNGLGVSGANTNGAASIVSFGGNVYTAHWLATEQQLVDTEPGTNANIWIFLQVGEPGPRAPLWVAASPVGRYFVGYGFLHYGINSRAVFLGCYCESDNYCVFTGGCTVFGGALATIIRGSSIGASPSGLYSTNTMLFGSVGLQTHVADGQNFLTMRGVDPLTEVWRFKRLSNGNLRFDNADLGVRNVYEITGPAATVPWKLSVSDWLVGGVREGVRSAIPTTEFWPTGSYLRNSNVATGQPRGWRCTAGGTPGTWVADSNWP